MRRLTEAGLDDPDEAYGTIQEAALHLADVAKDLEDTAGTAIDAWTVAKEDFITLVNRVEETFPNSMVVMDYVNKLRGQVDSIDDHVYRIVESLDSIRKVGDELKK